jgi:predicted outer membrane repeat protein
MFDLLILTNYILDLTAGGLYISDQDFSISNSIFTGNSASNGGGLVAFNSKNELILRNVTFTDNTAFSHGGGVYIENIVADIRGVSCSFIRNSAGGNGGGLYFKNNNVMYMADSVISENSAEYGGGVYNYFPGLEVYERVQFLNNDALQGGGGMRGRYLETTLRDCHVVGNTALWGGGVSISNGNGYHFDADNCSFVENDAANSGG